MKKTEVAQSEEWKYKSYQLLVKWYDINSLVIDTTFIFTRYIEDIYSLAVNTINIVIECNENISIFHECEARVKIWMFSLHEMKIFMVFTEKE